jgi:multidrug efflux system outer membrane protein
MNMKNKINLSGTLLTRLALFSIALLAFNSCRIYKSYERPENMPTSGLFRDTLTTTGVLTSDTINFGNTPWRQVFTDPALQSLIERALERNTDLLSAEETVKQAQAMLTASKLAYLPSLSLSPQGTISSFDGAKATKTYSLPVTASWQLDIFGSIRNAKEQSKSVLLQSSAYKQSVQTQLIANIASLYYTMLMLDEQLRITRETSEIWKKNVDAMEAMQKAAMTDAAAVEQSRANYLQVLATIPTLEQSIRESENALSVILREPPHTITRSTLAEQHMSENLSAGVPLQLLANRPDVRAAEYSLREAFYVTNAAYSAFYPQLTITGSAGWTNSNGMIVNPGKVLTTLIGQLTQPLFAQGRLTANLKVAKSQERVAQLNFEQALLNAGQEVSNALYSYKSSMEKANLDKKQVESLTITRDRTNELFKYDASTTYLEKLTAEMSLLNAQLTLVNDEYSKLQAVVDLYAALGGGRN